MAYSVLYLFRQLNHVKLQKRMNTDEFSAQNI